MRRNKVSSLKGRPSAFFLILVLALAAGSQLNSSRAGNSVTPRAGADAPMTPFTGGTFEASGVAHVPGTDGVLFVDDGRTQEIFWMRLGEDGRQVGAIRRVKLGADVIDMEGMTFDGTHFYAVGSQSKSKGGDLAGLVRFRFDPQTGQAVGTEAPAAGLLLTLAASAVAQGAAEYRELPKFSQVGERLYRGAQPRRGGLRRLAELGVNTVINLRGADDRTRSDEAEARALGLNYFNVPLPRWGRPDDTGVRRVLEIIDAPESGRVFVHCRDGVDRTGTVTAIYRITREGWTLREALTEAKRRGMRWINFWMRDYIEDYGPLRGRGAGGEAQQQVNEEDLSDRIGAGVRIVEGKAFTARKAGIRALRRVPGAVSDLLDEIF